MDGKNVQQLASLVGAKTKGEGGNVLKGEQVRQHRRRKCPTDS